MNRLLLVLALRVKGERLLVGRYEMFAQADESDTLSRSLGGAVCSVTSSLPPAQTSSCPPSDLSSKIPPVTESQEESE